MNPQISFTPEEELAIERILASISQRAKFTRTLSYLMDTWSRFVINVEQEYRLTIDDYTNRLCTRNHTQEVLDACSENISFKEWISEWDQRFEKATEIVKEPLLPPLRREKLGWWWFRIPTHPGPRLREWFELTK